MLESFLFLLTWFGTVVLGLVPLSRARLLIKHAQKKHQLLSPVTKGSAPDPIQKPSVPTYHTGNAAKLRHISALKFHHETAFALNRLIEHDGAGAWPPATRFDSWPVALRPYHDIYLEVVPFLSTDNPLAEHSVIVEHRDRYRSMMSRLLSERVDLGEVKELLIRAEVGDRNAVPKDVYNALYCAVAVCRHAYRWAMIPVVKVAQAETVLDFPPELDIPWPYLQRHFGVSAESGNNTANVLHNFDSNGQRVYKINVGMNDSIRSSEDNFFRMFYDLEVLAFPIYHEMVQAMQTYTNSNHVACLSHLQSITLRTRHLLTIFYSNMVEARIQQSAWLSYVQGFQGWGVGRMVGKEFVKYDGLSGNHVLFFQALDAFLGIERYLSDANMILYIPKNQREFCNVLRGWSFRAEVKRGVEMATEGGVREGGVGDGGELKALDDELQKIVNHLKVFRSAHRARVMPYLKHPAPERLTMTAGKSVLETPDTKDVNEALKVLDDMLVTRLKQTV